MKVLSYILTAAAVLIGADVFIMSSSDTTPMEPTAYEESPALLTGGTGIPPTPSPN